MFGNLSKNLVKAPHYFNNNIDTEPNLYSKIAQENILDTFSNLRKTNSKNITTRYFKERDFIKKNLKIDLNYNNNFRKEITPTVRTRPCVSFEEFIFGNTNTNTNTNNFTRQSLNKTNMTNKTNKTNKSHLTKSVDTKFNLISPGKVNYQKYLEKSLISKNAVNEFNGIVKSNVNNLINKINQNSLNLNMVENKFEKNGKNRRNRIENLKEYINKDTVVEAPVKLKFPGIMIKSQDTLYREAMDNKVNSLTLLSPKIKEQLKNKNRQFASEKDYYRYNNSYYMYKQNPFSESVKYLEDMKKNEFI